MKLYLFRVHKWLALIFSLPLLVMATTGMIMAFTPEAGKVKTPENSKPLSEILQIFKTKHADWQVMRVLYNPATVTIMAKKQDVRLLTFERTNGELIKNINPRDDIFIFSKSIHESFLLGGTGKNLVAASGLGLCLILISGLWFWLRGHVMNQLKKLYQLKSFKRLKDFHILIGVTLFMPLLFTAVSGTLIEWNSLLFNNAQALSHTIPTHCDWDQQEKLMGRLASSGKGAFFLCRPGHPYLHWSNAQGSHQLTPDGKEVLLVAKKDWQSDPRARKSFFVHWHGGKNFGDARLLYIFVSSLSLIALIFSGLLIWFNKRRKTGYP